LRVAPAYTADRIAALPLGSFVSYNRLSGATLEGRLF